MSTFNKRRVITEDVTVGLDREDIIEALQKAGHDVPDNATVSFRVPGGGDWSNMSVEITRDDPVRVCWKTKEVVDE